MLSPQAQALIVNHSAGMVGTTNQDGSPAVSPKATFVVIDAKTIAFGNIRSPGTLANIRRDPRVEICFVDVLLRKSVRVSGRAVVVAKNEAPQPLQAAFEAAWGPFLEHISSYVRIDIDHAEVVLSPAYDLGMSEAELREANLAKLNAL